MRAFSRASEMVPTIELGFSGWKTKNAVTVSAVARVCSDANSVSSPALCTMGVQ